MQPVGGELLDLAVAPLHDHHGVGQRDVEVQVLHLVEPAGQPVRVDVDQRGPAGQRGVDAGDDEGRRGDGPADAEPFAQPPGQRGLARAQFAAEQDQVAGAQDARQAEAEPPHGLGRVDGEAEGVRAAHGGGPGVRCFHARQR